MDHGGWYNRKELIKIDIVDIVFLSAMGPPGGGRSEISTRLVRHFNLITYNNFGESDLRKIFSKILTSFLGPYEDEVKGTI